MRYYEYSPKQLEQKAYETLKTYDSSLLTKPKQIDVYDVIEKVLDVVSGQVDVRNVVIPEYTIDEDLDSDDNEEVTEVSGNDEE